MFKLKFKYFKYNASFIITKWLVKSHEVCIGQKKITLIDILQTQRNRIPDPFSRFDTQKLNSIPGQNGKPIITTHAQSNTMQFFRHVEGEQKLFGSQWKALDFRFNSVLSHSIDNGNVFGLADLQMSIWHLCKSVDDFNVWPFGVRIEIWNASYQMHLVIWIWLKQIVKNIFYWGSVNL